MAQEELLVNCYVFVSFALDANFQFSHSVHQKKRVSVRQYRLYLFNIQNFDYSSQVLTSANLAAASTFSLCPLRSAATFKKRAGIPASIKSPKRSSSLCLGGSSSNRLFVRYPSAPITNVFSSVPP